MKKCKTVILAMLVPLTLVAASLAAPDLSSPEKALDSYMSLKRKGGTLDEFKKIISKEYASELAGFNAFAGALEKSNGQETNSDNEMPPEDKYAKVTVVKKQATDDRAIFQVKVKYNEEWLKQESEALKTIGAQDSNSADQQPSDVRTIPDASPGEEADSPYQVKGEGFVSFLFVKQDGAWRFHKYYASIQPSDFTPLLNAKNLSEGGITFTPHPPSEPPPVLPAIAPDKPLSGLISGKKWDGKFVYLSEMQSKPSQEFKVEVVDRDEPNWIMRCQIPHVMLSLPKTPGSYALSPIFNVTFFDPQGNKNNIATQGSMKVQKEGDIYKVNLVAYFDKDNEAQGTFSFTPTNQVKMEASKAVGSGDQPKASKAAVNNGPISFRGFTINVMRMNGSITSAQILNIDANREDYYIALDAKGLELVNAGGAFHQVTGTLKNEGGKRMLFVTDFQKEETATAGDNSSATNQIKADASKAVSTGDQPKETKADLKSGPISFRGMIKAVKRVNGKVIDAQIGNLDANSELYSVELDAKGQALVEAEGLVFQVTGRLIMENSVRVLVVTDFEMKTSGVTPVKPKTEQQESTEPSKSAPLLATTDKQPSKVGGDSIVGVWRWFISNTLVMCHEDGSVEGAGNWRGTWKKIPSKSKENNYEVVWNDGASVDTLTLSLDGKHLAGKNQIGQTITAERVESANRVRTKMDAINSDLPDSTESQKQSWYVCTWTRVDGGWVTTLHRDGTVNNIVDGNSGKWTFKNGMLSISWVRGLTDNIDIGKKGKDSYTLRSSNGTVFQIKPVKD